MYYRLLFCILFGWYLHPKIQKSHLGDAWYPQESKKLQQTMDDIEQEARALYSATLNSTCIKVIIAPHAGYAYSGAVAASVYRLLAKHAIRRVIILAPDHAVSCSGIALPSFDWYETALGFLKIDTSSIISLSQQELFGYNNAVFETEHSLEMQLPLMQKYLAPEVKVVPLIVGSLTCQQAKKISASLIPLIDSKTLIVVTTDFTHYGKAFNFTPFTKNIFYAIRSLDSRVIIYIEDGKCSPYAAFMNTYKPTICGYYPLLVLLSLLESGIFGLLEPRLIAYDTSGLQQHRDDHSVSYAGIVMTTESIATLPIEHQLTQQEQRGLLQEAHDVLEHLFTNDSDPELFYPIRSFGVRRTLGAFTTLKMGKELRGCIGRVTTQEPLYKTVATVTHDAALRDSRFAPVTPEEIAKLSVELSILSQSQHIQSYKEITLGKDGVILENGGRSALFLPEVPLEFDWNRETMLEQLCKKAGLRQDAWKKNSTYFSVFRTVKLE